MLKYAIKYQFTLTMRYLMACQSHRPITTGCHHKPFGHCRNWAPILRLRVFAAKNRCGNGPSASGYRCARRGQRLEDGDPGVGMGVYAAALWLMGRADALPALADPSLDRSALELDVREARQRLARKTKATA